MRTPSDGEQAVEIAADFGPEIGLMDMGMPRVNGYDAAQHIRGEDWGKELTLVALTCSGQEKTADPFLSEDLAMRMSCAVAYF